MLTNVQGATVYHVFPVSNYKPKIVIIGGPTASGKSEMALQLVRRFNGEIVSADSRQVYRGMDIGTGKVTRTQQRNARHWMLDVASPTPQYSVYQWRRGAQQAIASIVRRGKVPFICGGTGFWIDTLVYDLTFPTVKPDKKLRERFGRLTAKQLFELLGKLDPERAATIDRHNPVRLIRAIEIVMKSGRPVPKRTNGSPYEPLYLVISVPQNELNRRIAKRLDGRLHAGMIAEVRRLHASGVSWKRLGSFGLEYKWIAQFLQKKITRDMMRESLLRDIIAYSKRQITWWRKNPNVIRVSSTSEAEKLVQTFLK